MIFPCVLVSQNKSPAEPIIMWMLVPCLSLIVLFIQKGMEVIWSMFFRYMVVLRCATVNRLCGCDSRGRFVRPPTVHHMPMYPWASHFALNCLWCLFWQCMNDSCSETISKSSVSEKLPTRKYTDLNTLFDLCWIYHEIMDELIRLAELRRAISSGKRIDHILTNPVDSCVNIISYFIFVNVVCMCTQGHFRLYQTSPGYPS